jgi:hypothetical protein
VISVHQRLLLLLQVHSSFNSSDECPSVQQATRLICFAGMHEHSLQQATTLIIHTHSSHSWSADDDDDDDDDDGDDGGDDGGDDDDDDDDDDDGAHFRLLL